MKRHLCLNGIVRNEAARIVRMLDSVKDHIATFAILDTNSTDDTVAVIQKWGVDNGIEGIVGLSTFEDFSQARNEALELARSWWKNPDAPKFSYLLLVDADMELAVTDPNVFSILHAPAYEMVQKAGGMSYNNVRLVHVGPEFKYVGVTHEYLDCGRSEFLGGAHFVDHADGSNRAEKFPRDIRLLQADLKRDPENPRTWFYLANTYRDKGDTALAIDAYRKRITLGGWDEEVWTAQVNLANCLEKQGCEDAYIKETLAAFEMRPCRAEPLHALAKHYRQKGSNALAMIFAQAGINIPRPNDRLFIEDWVYQWGFLEEISIAGYYDERTRDYARIANITLAQSNSVPWTVRQQARNNMAFFLKPLSTYCPSAALCRIAFDPPNGFTPMNPSVTSTPAGDVELIIRCVNYKINEHGCYMIGEKGCQDAPIHTENFLAGNHKNLADIHKIRWARPEAKFSLVIGLEDMRVFYRDGYRNFIANVREQSAWGQCEQWTGRLWDGGEITDARRVSDGQNTEKNWMPWHDGRYVYRLDKLIDEWGVIEKVERDIAVDNISGGSQWIVFNGGLLSVVHESLTHPGTGKRVYQHRFAWLSRDFQDLKLSDPFVYESVQIEFCAGLALDGDKLIMSLGIRDEEAWLCEMDAGEVACILDL